MTEYLPSPMGKGGFSLPEHNWGF